MPATIDSAMVVIESLLVATFPTVTMRFPNMPLTPPTGQLWLDCAVLWGTSVPRSMRPAQRNAVIGVAHFNIYTPQRIGQGQARRMGDSLRDLFNRARLLSGTGQPIYWDVPSGLKAQRSETIDGGIWDVSTITCSFQAEEVIG